MRRIAALLQLLCLLAASPLAAQQIAYEPLTDAPAPAEPEVGGARLLGVGPAQTGQGVLSTAISAGAYGPFRLIDESHAALVGVTDDASPAAFDALLRDHPGIATIEMIACPGTEDDRANLRLGLMIRARSIATHVPEGGFVASGAVELFLAGVRRSAEPGAQFGVHSWEDDRGRQAQDYPADAPKNLAYLDYYRAVGLTAPEARAFYAMTNAVPFESVRWLSRDEMAEWVQLEGIQRDGEPETPIVSGPITLAVLDSNPTLQ